MNIYMDTKTIMNLKGWHGVKVIFSWSQVGVNKSWCLTNIVVDGSHMASKLGMAVVLAQAQAADGGTLQSNEVGAVVDLTCSKEADCQLI